MTTDVRDGPKSGGTLDVPCPTLQQMYATNQTVAANGGLRELSSAINPECAEALFRIVKERKPENVVEVGCAYGGSALSILTALASLGPNGRLTSVDPAQSTGWGGAGRAAIERAGYGDRHRLIEDYDYFALPKLLLEKNQFDFAYIDGWHTFDYAMLDFFYLDKMLRPGGIMAFNDAQWRAVHKVIKYVLTHRKYREVDVGLKKNYGSDNFAKQLYRRVEGRVLPDRYFEKLEQWEPTWDFYASF